MKKTIGILGMAILIFSLSSCVRGVICMRGSGDIITEQRTTDPFDELHVNIPATVYILQDENIDDPQITIEAQENIVDNINTYVRGDELKLKFRECVLSHRPINIYLTVADLDEIKLNGSGKIFTDNVFKTEYLTADLNGSGDFELELEVSNFEAIVDGSGDFELEGIAENIDIRINGSGDIHAFDLETKNADIHINGSGNADVHVLENLWVKINGSGDVRYMGNPATDISINGSGNVMQY